MSDKKDERQEERHELVQVLMPDALMSKSEILTSTDMLAYLLLKDFIVSGYPAIDARKQVDAAYSYAELMAERRKKT